MNNVFAPPHRNITTVSFLQSTTYPIEFPECKFKVRDFVTSITVPYVYEDMARVGYPELHNPKMAIDLGANIGMWAFRMKCNYPQMHIKAYEPIEINARHLRSGIQLNKFEGIEVIERAVTKDGRYVKLGMDRTNSGSPSEFNATLTEQNGGANIETFVCPSDTLDEAIGNGLVDVLKVDIEGGEFEIFETFTKWDQINHIMMEVHPHVPLGDPMEHIQKLCRHIAPKIQGSLYVDSTESRYRLGVIVKD